MVAVIWSLLQPYLLEIFKHRLDQGQYNKKWKRSTIGQFMALYDSMLELEDASRAAYEEFFDIGVQHGAIAKTIVASRLEKIRTTSKHFVQCARNIRSILNIYNDELAITLTGVNEIKRTAWYQLDAWLDAMPSNLDDDRRLSNIISFSKVLPTRSYFVLKGEQVAYPALSEKELEHEAEGVKRRLIQKLKADHGDILDLRDEPALKAQLDSLAQTIEEMANARVQLAQFIKSSYPVEKMMDDASTSRS